MFTLAALFCSVLDFSDCVSATPPLVFKTEEECNTVALAEIPRINFEAVTLQYKCISWGEPS